jgi:hypothetical protein
LGFGDKSFSGCSFGLKQCDPENPYPLHEKHAPRKEALNKLITEETVQNIAKEVNKIFRMNP